MTRNLKALGLALVAVFAMSAIGVQAASAEVVQHTFTSDAVGNTALTGTSAGYGKHRFFPDGTGSEVESLCDAAFASTAEGAAVEELTVDATYTNCETLEPGDTEVKMNQCDYLFTGDTNTDGHAPVHVDCDETGSQIELIVKGICTLKFGEQTPTSGGVHYYNANDGNKDDVEVEATVEGVHFSKSGFFCFAVPGNGTEGVYLGGATVRGYEDGEEHIPANQVNISVSPGDETE